MILFQYLFDNCFLIIYVFDFIVFVDDEVFIRDDGGVDFGDVFGLFSGIVFQFFFSIKGCCY